MVRWENSVATFVHTTATTTTQRQYNNNAIRILFTIYCSSEPNMSYDSV